MIYWKKELICVTFWITISYVWFSLSTTFFNLFTFCSIETQSIEIIRSPLCQSSESDSLPSTSFMRHCWRSKITFPWSRLLIDPSDFPNSHSTLTFSKMQYHFSTKINLSKFYEVNILEVINKMNFSKVNTFQS